MYAPLHSANGGRPRSKHTTLTALHLKEVTLWREILWIFAQHNTERAVQATNWMRTMAEQNFNQSKAALEGLLTFTRNALRSVDQQSSALCEHSIAVAEQTLSNAFDFAHKVIRVKEPRELTQIQSDFDVDKLN